MIRKIKYDPSILKTRMIAFAILSIIPPLMIVLAVIKYGFNFPYLDEWELVPQVINVNQGIIQFPELAAWHNEHRPFFPRSIMLASAQLTHWNISYELAINIFFGIILFFILLKQIKKAFIWKKTGLPFFLAPIISLIFFSFSGWENWVWGWQIEIWLATLSAVSGLFILTNYKKSLKWLIFAIFLGIISLYSFASGIAYMITGLIVLATSSKNPVRVKMIFIWTAATTVFLGTYFINFNKSMDYAHFIFSAQQIIKITLYIFAYLGSPLSVGNLQLAILFGVFCALMNVFLPLAYYKYFKSTRILPFVALSVFILANAAITGIGRANLALIQALASRYVLFSSLSWISNIIIFSLIIAEAQRSKTTPSRTLSHSIFYCFLGSVVFFSGISSILGLNALEAKFIKLKKIEMRLKDSQNTLADLSMFQYMYPNKEILLERVALLKEHKLSVFK